MMSRAIELAKQAMARGEVPVGAVITGPDGVIIAEAHNRIEELKDPTAHAEMLAIKLATEALGSERLIDCDLYVSLEPCTMCAGAMVHARVSRLVFAAREPRAGVVCSTCALLDEPWYNHVVTWQEGVMAEESSRLLRAFFRARR